MRRGCIVIGEVICDGCNRCMEHGERYLISDDEENEEIKQRFCADCCLSRKYADFIIEKGEKVLTIFAEDVQ